MRIAIMGAGLTGLVCNYLLKKMGHNTCLIDRNNYTGHIMRTFKHGGINHEFGPHVFYTKDEQVRNFIKDKLDIREQKYIVHSKIGERTYLFPMHIENIMRLEPEKALEAIKEIYHINLDKPDYENFEKYQISRIGKTLYNEFIKPYSQKQWMTDLTKMDTEWAKFRAFTMRTDDKCMFGKDMFQGHPGSYNKFLDLLAKDADEKILGVEYKQCDIVSNEIYRIKLNNERIRVDFVINTIPLDVFITGSPIMDYRSVLKKYYLLDQAYYQETYCITYPQEKHFTRIFEYKHQSGQQHDNTLISIAYPYDPRKRPKEFGDERIKKCISKFDIENDFMYPVSTKQNIYYFMQLLDDACGIKNMVTLGRLGLYSYISMDTAIWQAIQFCNNFDKYLKMDKQQKYEFLINMRGRLS